MAAKEKADTKAKAAPKAVKSATKAAIKTEAKAAPVVKAEPVAKATPAAKTPSKAKAGAKREKVVLAYSGGLDTTVIIPWLKENYDYDVIAVCIDVGQGDDWKKIKQRALDTGASQCYVVDAREEYITDFVYPALKANAIYEDRYLLGTSTARPLIAKILVEYARSCGAVAISHGATGKGNDQIRFELTIKAFAPDLKIIAAWRDDKWDMDSREAEIKFLEDRKIPVPMKKDQSYSRDENIWHLSHEGLELEETENEPNWKHMLQLTDRSRGSARRWRVRQDRLRKRTSRRRQRQEDETARAHAGTQQNRRAQRRRTHRYRREPRSRNEEPRRLRNPGRIDSLFCARDARSPVPRSRYVLFSSSRFRSR